MKGNVDERSVSETLCDKSVENIVYKGSVEYNVYGRLV